MFIVGYQCSGSLYSYEKIMGLQGWIQVHRKICENWLWREKPYSRGQAWITMLLLANHTPNRVMICGEIVNCGRGQSVRAIATWQETFGWGRQKVRLFFDLLEKEKMIVVEGLRKTTRITIVNYGTYQATEPTKNQLKTNRKPTENQQKTTNNNDNKKNNDNNDNKNTVSFQEFQKYWNTKTMLPGIQTFTDTRKRQLKIRNGEPVFRDNWQKIIDKLAASDFHTGKILGKKWKATVDWILRNDTNYAKILELKQTGRSLEELRAERELEANEA